MDIGSISDWVRQGVATSTKGRPVTENSARAALSETAEGTPSAPVPAASRENVEEAVNSFQQFAQSVQRNIDFALDDSSGRVVVKVTDAHSGDVIRQIPSEEALKLAENLSEIRSLLFTAEA